MWQTSRTGRLDYLVVYRWRGDGYGPVGDLTFEGSGPRRNGRFRYASSYFGQDGAKAIDPVGLPLVRKSYAAAPEEVPLAFHDAGPDGWGKEILTRAFPTSVLSMPEYLALGGLGRTGDLAFGPTPTSGPVTWTPPEAPLVDLPDEADDLGALMDAAAAVEAGDAEGHHFKLLFRNSDVGGARPKARIRSEGRQWIAKFPTSLDKFDDPRSRRPVSTWPKRPASRFRAGRSWSPAAAPPSSSSASTGMRGRGAAIRVSQRGDPPEAVLGQLRHRAHLHGHRGGRPGDRREGRAGLGLRAAAPQRVSPQHRRPPQEPRLHRQGRRLDALPGLRPRPASGSRPARPGARAGDVARMGRRGRDARARGLPAGCGEAEAIRERVLQAARRLGEFMDAREVPPKDRRYLKDAFPEEMRFAR